MYQTFDEYAEKYFDIWKITFKPDPDEWKQAVCTCLAFDDAYVCKHIIGIIKMIGIIEKPAENNCDNQPIFKATRGRPKRPTGALNED